MTEEELKELNVSLWREWTLKATEVNCCKLCGAVVDDYTAEQFLRHVQGLEVAPEVLAKIGSIAKGEYIPPGLDCTLRGIHQPNHLMYKIEPIAHPSGCALYEFLVEYDRMEPNVGIYLGCKCVTGGDTDHRDMISHYIEEWNALRSHVCTVLNNSFPEKEFRHRFRITNNGENGTFWPTWISLYDDEDMEFALTVLRIIRKAYEQYFSGTMKYCRPLPSVAYRRIQAAFTESAFKRLREQVCGLYGREHEDDAARLFDRFILVASDCGIFEPDLSYDLAWRYMGDRSRGLSGSNIEFSTLMHTLVREIGRRLGSGIGDVKTPWGNIMKVFLDSDGVAYKSGTRTQWQNALCDTVSACRDLVTMCLDYDQLP